MPLQTLFDFLRLPMQQQRRLRQRIRRVMRPAWLGSLRRTSPLSNQGAADRGVAVQGYYIDRFLSEQRQDIRGNVLELHTRGYAERYASTSTPAALLNHDPANSQPTIVANLPTANELPAERFDCLIMVHTLPRSYDLHSAVAQSYHALKPGGVVLATLPSVSQLGPTEQLADQDYWRLTVASCQRLFGDVFGPAQVTVRAHGNVLTSVAALMGLAYDELPDTALDTHDPFFPLLVTVRAVKGSSDGQKQ